MKNQINFSVAEDQYSFDCGDNSFVISKADMELDAKKLYEAFFEGLSEKPDYEICSKEEKLDRQDNHVFKTVQRLLGEIQNGIKEEWFAPKLDQVVETQ